MKSFCFIFGIFSLVVTSGLSQRFLQNQSCRTPLGTLGQCISLKNCPEVLKIYRTVTQSQATAYSRQLQRLCNNQVSHDNYPILCCMNGSPLSSDTEMTSAATIPTSNPTTSAATDLPKPELKSEGVPCEDPNSVSGYCKALMDCPVWFNKLKEAQGDQELISYIRSSHAKCGSVGKNICCPSEASIKPGSEIDAVFESVVATQLPTEINGCGTTEVAFTKIVGGEESQIGAWPWIALIGYDKRSLQPFLCGGTLITVRHVLTAAHCIRADLSFVRLGEFDVASDTDTRHIDIDVTKSVPHADFSARDKRNDIAMLYLKSRAPLSELIKPICLPLAADLREKSFVNDRPFVAGWGRTERGTGSNVLKQLQINVYETSVCRNAFLARSRFFKAEYLDESVMCAGILIGGADSCKGDSGGPLMMPELYKGKHHFYLIGVVSYGLGCGEVGVPGIYARVQNYLDWIQARVKEA